LRTRDILFGATALAALGICPSHGDAVAASMASGKVVFRCNVAAGPRLTSCAPTTAPRLDAAKVETLRSRVESACPQFLEGLVPGMTTLRTVGYVDSDMFWSHDPNDPSWLTRPTSKDSDALYRSAPTRLAGSDIRMVVRCRIGLDGLAKDCNVSGGPPNEPAMDAAAIRLMTNARFRPRLVDCKPVGDGELAMPLRFGGRRSP